MSSDNKGNGREDVMKHINEILNGHGLLEPLRSFLQQEEVSRTIDEIHGLLERNISEYTDLIHEEFQEEAMKAKEQVLQNKQAFIEAVHDYFGLQLGEALENLGKCIDIDEHITDSFKEALSHDKEGRMIELIREGAMRMLNVSQKAFFETCYESYLPEGLIGMISRITDGNPLCVTMAVIEGSPFEDEEDDEDTCEGCCRGGEGCHCGRDEGCQHEGCDGSCGCRHEHKDD